MTLKPLSDRPIRYISTRYPELGAVPIWEIIGRNRDAAQGLPVPDHIPSFSADDLHAMQALSPDELAVRIFAPFMAPDFDTPELRELFRRVLARWSHPAICPLRQVAGNIWLAELAYGPAKVADDFAAQLGLILWDAYLARRGETITLLTASASEAGAAISLAAENCRHIRSLLFFPEQQVAPAALQALLHASPNRAAVAGNLVDIERLLIDLVRQQGGADSPLRLWLPGEWWRVLGCLLPIFAAALALGAPARPIAFVAPAGHLTWVYALELARNMGLPIARVTIASNRNDGVTQLLQEGEWRYQPAQPSLAPMFDIAAPVQLERWLFGLFGGDPFVTNRVMADWRSSDLLQLSARQLSIVRRNFSACRIDDSQIISQLAASWQQTGMALDPHSAVTLAAALGMPDHPAIPTVALGCGNPAYYPEILARAAGMAPPNLVLNQPYLSLPAELGAVAGFLKQLAVC